MRVDLDWRIRPELAERRVAEAAARGLRVGGEHVLTVSRQRAPVDTGTLRRSGRVTVDAGGQRVAVSYNTPYAVRQHFEHDTRGNYLEGPARQEAATVRQIYAAQVRRVLG